MARISIRNVQKSTVAEYFNLYLSSAAAKGVKDKILETYKFRVLLHPCRMWRIPPVPIL